MGRRPSIDDWSPLARQMLPAWLFIGSVLFIGLMVEFCSLH